MNELLTSDSILDKFKLLKEMNAGIIKVVPKSKAGEPLGAVIFVAAEESQEILDAVEQIENSWEE